MSDVLGLAASAAGGGVFGLFGTALGRAAAFFEQRQKNAHERARWTHELELAAHARAAASEARADTLTQTTEEGRWAGLTASLQADNAIAPSYRWVDAIRGLTRPILTLTLWVIAVAIYASAPEAGRSQITETATFAATAATLWWFGDRGPVGRQEKRQ